MMDGGRWCVCISFCYKCFGGDSNSDREEGMSSDHQELHRQSTRSSHTFIHKITSKCSGDRLNFGFACERAKSEGFNVQMVIVNDDCALDSDASIAGRYVCVCICMYVYVYVCMCMYMYVCVCMCMCMCMYVYVYVYVCVDVCRCDKRKMEKERESKKRVGGG